MTKDLAHSRAHTLIRHAFTDSFELNRLLQCKDEDPAAFDASLNKWYEGITALIDKLTGDIDNIIEEAYKGE